MLVTRSLSVTFGGVKALDEVDLEVPAGALMGIIGPNGAGKTTLIDAVTGFVPATGRITFAGHDMTGLAPHRRARLGLGRTWQSTELFDDLTVRENLQVAADRPTLGAVLIDLVRPRRHRDESAVDDALDLLGITDLADALPTELSHGRRKLVGVARALAGRPRLICLDEPAAGLDSNESRALGDELRRIVDSGVTLLLVDHDMDLVLDVCTIVHVIDNGRTVAVGPPGEIAADERVVEAYLGRRARAGES